MAAGAARGGPTFSYCDGICRICEARADSAPACASSRGRARRPAWPPCAPHRVPQQVRIDRIVHIGLHAERTGPPVQRLARLFSGRFVPRPGHQLPDLRQQLRAQKRDFVDRRLLLAGVPECPGIRRTSPSWFARCAGRSPSHDCFHWINDIIFGFSGRH